MPEDVPEGFQPDIPEGFQPDEPENIQDRPDIKLSPYDKARLSGMEPVAGPFGPANPQEVVGLANVLTNPIKELPTAKGKGFLPAAYNAVIKPAVEGLETPGMLLAAPLLAESIPARIGAGVLFGGMAAKSGIQKMGEEDPQKQLEGRMELAGAPLLALTGGLERARVKGGEAIKPEASPNAPVPEVAPPVPEATAAVPKQPAPASETVPPVAEPAKGITASVRNKWTSATDPEPVQTTGESGFINLDPIRELVDKATPHVKAAFQAVKEIGKEAQNAAKLTDYRKSILGWSAKLQRSFGEAADAQREISEKVPKPERQDGITNWIQADGDPAVLAQRRAATEAWRDPVTSEPHPQQKQLLAGYDAALNLTPEEVAVANDVKNAYGQLGQRGQQYNVLNSFKQNYVTQIWDLKKGPTGTGSSRTLKDKFKFSKASTFPTFFDGEQAGYVPKTKNISKLLPVYLHEMNSVIAARQLVEQMGQGVASDGRPLLAPRGGGTPVTNPQGGATLITPKSMPKEIQDYREIPNQPALNNWTWASKDTAGNPVYLKSDLVIHPEAYDRLRAVLGRSAIREWYDSKTTATAQIPKTLVKLLDNANSETKKTMLGMFAPFHQVQEGTHAIGHRVNPFFRIPKVDLVHDAGQLDAAKHGLMLLPDRASANQFMEGYKTSGIVSKIPGLGPVADHYSNYLFHEYIPGLKYKTYQAILGRNMKLYSSKIAAGEFGPADIKVLSAEQANAAYGHLNYADLGRNPTIQHIAQLFALAPDFLESRARFTGQTIKGLTGAKVGREQLLALGTLALAQATLAYTSAGLTGGQWDGSRPFEFVKDKRRYTMRSVPEDISSLLHDTRIFVHSRLSPIIAKGGLQYSLGRDYRGKEISAGETTKQLLEQPIPISVRGFLGLGNSTLSGMEQLAGAVGLKISRYNPDQPKIDEAMKINDFADKLSGQLRRMPVKDRFKFVTDQAGKEKFTQLERNKLVQHLRKKGAFTYPPEE